MCILFLLRLPEIRNKPEVSEAGADGAGLAAEMFGDVAIFLLFTKHFREQRVIVLAPRPSHVGVLFAKCFSGAFHGLFEFDRPRRSQFLRPDGAKKILLKFFFFTLRESRTFLTCRI